MPDPDHPDNLGTAAILICAAFTPLWIVAHPRETAENWTRVNPAAERLAGRR